MKILPGYKCVIGDGVHFVLKSGKEINESSLRGKVVGRVKDIAKISFVAKDGKKEVLVHVAQILITEPVTRLSDLRRKFGHKKQSKRRASKTTITTQISDMTFTYNKKLK